MIDRKKFKLALTSVYEQNPCRVLPNAMWKTEERLNTLQYSCRVIHDQIVDLKAWDQQGIHVFWNKDRELDEAFQQIKEDSQFLIIHDDYFRQIDVYGYSLIKPYFRISHDNQNISSYAVSVDFYIREAYPERECTEISDFISKCYRNLRPGPDTVRSWIRHRVFDRNLWIWIMDRQKDLPVALGIAEFDSALSEGTLEWIQVLPDYQGRGLGKVLILELLNRLQGRAKFTTVSGEMDNKTNPERLYRKCGFVGNDVWWLLQR